LKRGTIIVLAVVFLLSFGCSDDDSTTRPDTETVSTPAFNPPGGSYDSVVFVKITCATGDAERYYTLDGSDPDKSASQLAAGDSIELDNTTIIRARAYKDGMDSSAVAQADYVIDFPDVAEPVIDKESGVYNNNILVSLTCPTMGADIYFTTDGSTPDTNSALFGGMGILLDTSCVLKARGFKEGMDPSPVVSAEYTLIPDLVAYYPFDGNADDMSGQNHDGTVCGASLAVDRFGNADAAYHFDGTDDYIELSDETAFDFTEYTISFWVRISTLPTIPDPLTPGYYCLINKGSNYGNYTLRLSKSGGASYCRVNIVHVTSTGNWTTSSFENITLDQYYHVVVTMSDEIRCYYNGVLGSTSLSMPDPLLNNDQVFIGKNRSGTDSFYFEGIIDDVRFYDRALTGSEISALYDVESPE